MSLVENIFVNTMLQECLLLDLQKKYPDLEMGYYYHNAGSMHIYSRHFTMAEAIIKDERSLELPMVPMDRFDDDIMTGLVGVECAWREAGMNPDFDFEAVGAWQLLTPYWQNLIRMCFAEDDEAMHDVFGVPHEHEEFV